MADPHYVGFERDYSDNGIFQTTMFQKRDVPLFIPLWLLLDGERKVLAGGPYLSDNCIFTEQGEVEARIPKKDAPQIYKQDWDADKKETSSLACAGDGSDRRKLGSGVIRWPSGFVAPAPPKGSPTMPKRLNARSALWRKALTIPTTIDSETDRLWKPSSPWTGAHLTIYFTPYGAWPSIQALQGIVDATWAESTAKDGDLAGWLKYEVKAESDAKAMCFSRYRVESGSSENRQLPSIESVIVPV